MWRVCVAAVAVEEHVVVALQICLVGVGTSCRRCVIADLRSGGGGEGTCEGSASRGGETCVGRTAKEHMEDLAATEEHTEGLAAAEMDDSTGGWACGEDTCRGGRGEGVFFCLSVVIGITRCAGDERYVIRESWVCPKGEEEKEGRGSCWV